MLIRNKHNARRVSRHTQDVFTDLGFDYRHKIFEKTVSKPILENQVNKGILDEIQKMISYLVDNVKQIKLQYMISLDKNDRNLN